MGTSELKNGYPFPDFEIGFLWSGDTVNALAYTYTAAFPPFSVVWLNQLETSVKGGKVPSRTSYIMYIQSIFRFSPYSGHLRSS